MHDNYRQPERRSLTRRKASEALPLVRFERHCPWFSGAGLAPWRLPDSGHQGNLEVSRFQLPFCPEASQTQFTSSHPRPPLKSWTHVCPPHPYPGCVKSSFSLWAGNEVTWIFPCWRWHQLCRCLYLTWNMGCRHVKITIPSLFLYILLTEALWMDPICLRSIRGWPKVASWALAPPLELPQPPLVGSFLLFSSPLRFVPLPTHRFFFAWLVGS